MLIPRKRRTYIYRAQRQIRPWSFCSWRTSSSQCRPGFDLHRKLHTKRNKQATMNSKAININTLIAQWRLEAPPRPQHAALKGTNKKAGRKCVENEAAKQKMTATQTREAGRNNRERNEVTREKPANEAIPICRISGLLAVSYRSSRGATTAGLLCVCDAKASLMYITPSYKLWRDRANMRRRART